MADNNNVLTIVLVAAAVLLFSGNLTGNLGKQVPGSQVAAWCQSPEGKLIAEGDYTAYAVENNHYVIETCVSGNLRRALCPRLPLGAGANKRVSLDGCVDLAISNTIFPESY